MKVCSYIYKCFSRKIGRVLDGRVSDGDEIGRVTPTFQFRPPFLDSSTYLMLRGQILYVGVKTLRYNKIQESWIKSTFSSRNVVKTWYNLNFLELSILACLRRVFIPNSTLKMYTIWSGREQNLKITFFTPRKIKVKPPSEFLQGKTEWILQFKINSLE